MEGLHQKGCQDCHSQKETGGIGRYILALKEKYRRCRQLFPDINSFTGAMSTPNPELDHRTILSDTPTSLGVSGNKGGCLPVLSTMSAVQDAPSYNSSS